MTTRLLILLSLLSANLARAADPVQYNRDVRPILSDQCFSCHGADANQRKARLRLDVRESALEREAFVPGSPDESPLIERILTDDPEQVMPPPSTHRSLNARQKEILRRWIAEGAEYQAHWAYLPPAPVTPPEIVDAGDAIRNPIDAFIVDRLRREGLNPSPEAAKETLIRRVSLDLIGLPPAPEDVAAFVSDASPNAYEKVVDRLLNSPRYGERMAVDWLDAARYADSNGYQVDRDRELWPWRDWVINAFNRNLSFDQFTIEQLAGDLLPNATLEQRIATGFHRNHMLNEEGGIIAEEFLAEYTADRVETTAGVWLGQTFNCSRCHDHKYDPFTQRDFYAMKAFFHNIPENGVGNYGKPIRVNAPPFVKLPAPAVEAKLAALNARLKQVNERLSSLATQSGQDLESWAERVAKGVIRWEPSFIVAASGGEPMPRVREHDPVVEVEVPSKKAVAITIKTRPTPRPVNALRVECFTEQAEARFQWKGLQLRRPGSLKARPIVVDDSLAEAEAARILDRDPRTRAAIVVNKDRAVGVGVGLESKSEGDTPEDIELVLELEDLSAPVCWRVFATSADADLLVPADIRAIASKPSAERTAEETKRLSSFHVSQQQEHRGLVEEADSLKKQISAAEAEIPTTLVMEEMEKPRDTFVLMRGAYDKPGERVTAATPAALPGLDPGLPKNRLGLAKWLVGSQNPLTARVSVNRFWQQCFGTGLVRTSEDFGTRGEPPSHPELLDWLSIRFRESGWDVKALLRMIVTSATYRQSSRLTAALHERDPENRLLARGPRFRLPAEMIRDQALASSGLLVAKAGGPSVRPYHPPGLYEQVTAGNGYNVYVPGKGDDLHRRSLYTYWKRSVPHPAMLLFDAPFRETCTLRRPRSNTPLQALDLLNDPTYVEAARFLAIRMIREGGGDLDSRLTLGFRLLLARRPEARELSILRQAFTRSLADFHADPESARAWLSVGDAGSDAAMDTAELAAYASLASTLLNLDETITRE